MPWAHSRMWMGPQQLHNPFLIYSLMVIFHHFKETFSDQLIWRHKPQFCVPCSFPLEPVSQFFTINLLLSLRISTFVPRLSTMRSITELVFSTSSTKEEPSICWINYLMTALWSRWCDFHYWMGTQRPYWWWQYSNPGGSDIKSHTPNHTVIMTSCCFSTCCLRKLN